VTGQTPWHFPQIANKQRQGRRVISLQKDRRVFARKLAGKNAKEGVFTRFAGFRCASLPNGNGYAALPIGARLFGKKDFSSANENAA